MAEPANPRRLREPAAERAGGDPSGGLFGTGRRLHRQRAGPWASVSDLGRARDNSALVENDFNDVEINGARAALKVDLNDQWSVTPTIIYQKQIAHGTFAFDPALGDLEISHYIPERNEDRWHQAALTIEGKIGNFDLTYSGGDFRRDIDNDVDYSDYSYFYDAYYASAPAYFGDNFKDNGGSLISSGDVHGEPRPFHQAKSRASSRFRPRQALAGGGRRLLSAADQRHAR